MAESPTGTYALIEDGEITRVGGLPAAGYVLIDGGRCPVSNFHCLTDAELATADPPWLPVVADEPAYDEETERLSAPTYTIREADVLASYTVEPIPPES